MTRGMPSGAASRGGTGPVLLLLLILALGGAAFLLLGRAIPIDRSAIGFDGLPVWLARNGVAVASVLPAADDPKRAATLRVLPLLDDNIHQSIDDEAHDDDAKRLGTLAPREIDEATVERKLADATSLVVLPKWRRGIVDRGRAHPDLLIPPERILFFDEVPSVARPGGEPLRTIPVEDAHGASVGQATLYRPQVLAESFDESCEAIWTLDGVGTLLARCADYTYQGHSFFVLADPDLLDNHGLGLGDNAGLALKLVRAIAPDVAVFLDHGEREAGEAGDGADPRRQSFADLERFLRYPFSLVWLSLALVLVLAVWRGNMRFGRPRREARQAALLSKRDTIVASGRLMRMAGDEGELVLAYAQSRMDGLAAGLLGRRRHAAGTGADPAAPVFRFLAARAPDLGRRLERAHADLTKAEPRRRLALLAPFEAVFQEILDELGRTQIPQGRDRA